MPIFQFRIDWREEFGSREHAREHLEDLLDELRQLNEGDPFFEIIGHDIQALPGQHERSLVPEPRVEHPWDQGMTFFPPEHPLYEYEDFARERDRNHPDPSSRELYRGAYEIEAARDEVSDELDDD